MKPNSIFKIPSLVISIATILVPTRIDCNVNQSSFNLSRLRLIHMLMVMQILCYMCHLVLSYYPIILPLEVWGDFLFFF